MIMLYRIILITLVVSLLSGNTSAQGPSIQNGDLNKWLLQKANPKLESLYKESTTHTNSILKSGNIAQLKLNILKILKKNEDKIYIEQLFSTFNKDSFQGLSFSYQQGTFWLKHNEKQIIKIKTTNNFSTKIFIDGKDFDNSNYSSAKEAIEAFAKLFSPLTPERTVFDNIQSAFMINNAHASILGAAAISIVVYYEVFVASLMDMASSQACKQEIFYAIDETSRLLKSCEEELSLKPTLDWSTSIAGKILSSSKALHFLLEAKNVQDVTCEQYVKNKSKLSYQSAFTFFITTNNCFDADTRQQFCERSVRLQDCVAKSQKQVDKNNAVNDSSRDSKQSISIDSNIQSPQAINGNQGTSK